MFVQNGPLVIEVSLVWKLMDGGIGNDFGAVRLDPGVDLDPRSPGGGPKGIYTGCEDQLVKYWGHGYGVAVAQTTATPAATSQGRA